MIFHAICSLARGDSGVIAERACPVRAFSWTPSPRNFRGPQLIQEEKAAMAKYARILKVLGVILIGGGVQALLVLLGNAFYKDLPSVGAIEFTRAYFQKDPAMAERMCEDPLADDVLFAMDDDRMRAASEARSRGFGSANMTYLAYRIKTKTNYISETEASVRLTGKRRVSINPIYPYVAILFDLGEAHGIDETVKMVKQGGQWKVCESLSSVFQDI